jgi:hypothetical protein
MVQQAASKVILMGMKRVFRLWIPGLIVLLGAELYVCWTNRLVPGDWQVRHRLFREYYQPDDALLYKVRPNLSEFRVDWPDDDMTATYSTDARGFRNLGRDYSTSRVYFVGDSYVWGAWVSDQDSLCGYVEKDLGEPVINLGVGSYDFPRYQKLFEDLVVKYKPEIAVLSVFPNDLYLPRPIEPGTPGAGDAFYRAAGWDAFDHYPLYKKTLTYNLFDRIRRLLSSSRPGSGGDQYNQRPDRGARTASNGLTLFQYRGADRNYLVTKAAVDDVARRFARIIQLSADNNIKLLLLLCPTKESTYKRDYQKLFPESADYLRNEESGYELLASQAQAAGVPCVDLTPVFRRQGETEILYFRVDNHWNPAGNRLAATEAVKAIRLIRGHP